MHEVYNVCKYYYVDQGWPAEGPLYPLTMQ